MQIMAALSVQYSKEGIRHCWEYSRATSCQRNLSAVLAETPPTIAMDRGLYASMAFRVLSVR